MCPHDETKSADFNETAGKLPVMKLEDLLPTQMTIGMRAMHHKAHRLHRIKDDPKKLKEYLDPRPIEVALGPGGKAYIVDHHHLALAMLHEGYTTANVKIVDDFSKDDEEAFWKKMEEKKYVHPYDENGTLHSVFELPKHLKDLKDDPYRSLAAFVRDMAGFKKVFTPFVEFQWADYFRKNIPLKELHEHFGKSLRKAMKLARLPGAAHLPGFLGPKQPKDGNPKVA